MTDRQRGVRDLRSSILALLGGPDHDKFRTDVAASEPMDADLATAMQLQAWVTFGNSSPERTSPVERLPRLIEEVAGPALKELQLIGVLLE